MIVIGIIFVIETYSVIVFPVIAVISVTHKRQDFLHEKKKGKKFIEWNTLQIYTTMSLSKLIMNFYFTILVSLFKSNHRRFSMKKGVPRNFTKFIGTHQCQSLFFNKVAGLRLASLLTKRLWHRCIPVSFLKFLRTTFFIERLWWLLLLIIFMDFTWLLTSSILWNRFCKGSENSQSIGFSKTCLWHCYFALQLYCRSI